ncbi:MAG: carbon-nitrogen hydrolase family protein [Hyphomicrobiaceae bacterium]
MTTQPAGASGRFRVGLVQLRTGRDVEANLVATTDLIRAAARGGAQYVQTPENTNIMEMDRARLFVATRPEEGNPVLAHYRALARELGIWLHLGSVGVAVSADKIANRALLIDPKGVIVARYDKLHMFDVTLPGGESYRESRNFAPGATAVVADLPWCRLGITICYDLRFAHLYRALAKAGAQVLTVPSAFTRQTGEAHWHVLLRARAIETGCWVLAAAQGGRHENGRATFGHSLVVAPWGEVVAEGGIDPMVVFADVDCAKVEEARQRVPSLEHDREFEVVEASSQKRASEVT